MASVLFGAGSGSAEPENKKRKRNRPALSCSACKKAKIKCSRQIPCEACLRKNTADTCQWYNEDASPPTQSYQSQRTAEALRQHFEARLARIEAVLSIDTATNSADVVRQAAEQLVTDVDRTSRNETTRYDDGHPAAAAPAIGFALDGDVERAAMSLEVMAGGDGSGVIQDVKPVIQGIMSEATLEAFSANSILALDDAEGYPRNPRLPLLSYFSRDTLVEQFLGYVQTKERCDPIIAHYFDVMGWIFGSVHKGDLRRCYNAFWRHVDRGERRFDSAWLALLCMIFAIVLQARTDLQRDDLRSDDLATLGRACLELRDWRTKPTYRVVQTLYASMFYSQNACDLPAAMIFLSEGLGCCMSLGLHRLGSDHSIMPNPDPSCPPGSLRARETAVRAWWEFLSQDWISVTIHRQPMINQSVFDTAHPRPFSDEEIDREDFDFQPQQASDTTASANPSLVYVGKAATALFVKKAHDLGPVPTGIAEKEKHFNALRVLEAEYLERVGDFVRDGVLRPSILNDWRSHLATSGFAMRRCRLFRPYMVAGYHDARFAYATSTCLDGAQTVLRQIKILSDLKAPTSGVWFLSRHALSAITTLFIAVMHDIDTSSSVETCDEKLVNLPAALDLFKALETSEAPSARALGRKSRLMVQALQDAKEARRQTRGNRENYSQVLQRIASKVKQTPEVEDTAAPSSYFPWTASASNSAPTASSENDATPLDVNWLDDPETRDFLKSLGLFDSAPTADGGGGEDAGVWQPGPGGFDGFDWDSSAGLQATLDRLEGPL